MGSGGLKSVWLNMDFSSGLTLQMDLIVMRNSIFCHSACMLCVPAPRPPPLPRPSCRQRGPLSPALRVCRIEESGSARDQMVGRGERRRGRWNLEILSDALAPNSVTHKCARCEVCQYPHPPMALPVGEGLYALISSIIVHSRPA